MIKDIVKSWWAFVLQGVLAIGRRESRRSWTRT